MCLLRVWIKPSISYKSVLPTPLNPLNILTNDCTSSSGTTIDSFDIGSYKYPSRPVVLLKFSSKITFFESCKNIACISMSFWGSELSRVAWFFLNWHLANAYSMKLALNGSLKTKDF